MILERIPRSFREVAIEPVLVGREDDGPMIEPKPEPCACANLPRDMQHLKCHNKAVKGHALCDRCRLEAGGYDRGLNKRVG